MQKILLLDYDHTLYPSTLFTLQAVDERINLYIRTFLGFSSEAANTLRLEFWKEYGTTLQGLETRHGVDREHYTDFIHAIDEKHLPPPNPELKAWLSQLPHPYYMFTNARMDWPLRGLKAMGLADLLPRDPKMGTEEAAEGKWQGGTGFRGIFDITFMDWLGKPHSGSYAKVDAYLRKKHGKNIHIYFADDRIDNLETARSWNWTTLWVAPHDAPVLPDGTFDRIVPSLTRLDPVNFELLG